MQPPFTDKVMKKIIIVALLLMLSATVFSASYKSTKIFEVTGNSITDFCKKTSGYEYGVCLGYINGVAALQKQACIPEGVKFGQLKDVVLKYITENPESRHKPANKIITSALAHVWVCK